MKLEIRNAACGYDEDHAVIKNLNMVLQDGDVCCILGPNGVGKTTVFKTILNLIPPLAGQICIDGADIAGWSPKQMARYFAYVAQSSTATFPYTVREVALMGRMGHIGFTGQPGEKDYDIVEQAMEDVGIRHLADEQYTGISGGERQLLMIARALAQQSKILIMDEPTANLDYGNMMRVIETIRSLSKKGLCVIMTSHMPDQAFMLHAKAVLLQRNRAPQFGQADDIITERNMYSAYNTRVQILEVIGAEGIPMKVVTPHFES